MFGGLMEQANHIANIVLAVVVAAAAVVALLFGYFKFYRKRKRTKEDTVNYSGLKRYDSADYLKFDDIYEDMVVTDNGTRFVGVIRCTGFDLYSASYAEQLATKNAYISFIGMQKDTITYRQSCNRIDMEDTLERYYQQGKAIRAEISMLANSHEDMLKMYGEMAEAERADLEQAKRLELQIEECERQIEVRKWRLEHIADQIDFISAISKSKEITERVETYVFDWVYNALDYPIELGKEEIYQRAKRELATKASAMMHALSGCSVKAYRVQHDDLVHLFRRHYHPVTSELYGKGRIEGSSYFEDIVTAPAKDEIYAGAVEEFKTEMQESIMTQAQEFAGVIAGEDEDDKTGEAGEKKAEAGRKAEEAGRKRKAEEGKIRLSKGRQEKVEGHKGS